MSRTCSSTPAPTHYPTPAPFKFRVYTSSFHYVIGNIRVGEATSGIQYCYFSTSHRDSDQDALRYKWRTLKSNPTLRLMSDVELDKSCHACGSPRDAGNQVSYYACQCTTKWDNPCERT